MVSLFTLVLVLVADVFWPLSLPVEKRSGLDWWVNPIEKHARAKLPKVYASLNSVYFSDAQRGWAVGGNGTIVVTTDGGATWSAQTSGTSDGLNSVYFSDAQRGWAVGSTGTIVATTDGGATWSVGKIFVYQRYPPPLLLLLAIVSLVGLLSSYAVPLKGDRNVSRASVEGKFVSDKPIEDPRLAPVWMRRLVSGLADYFSNPNTAAPVTVSITGPWGQGKSSTMGLLRQELRQRGLSPVWFNAWHHQDAGNVLAALLGAIRDQAVPPLISFPERAPYLSFQGTVYRVRLLGLRFRSRWIQVSALGGLTAVASHWLSENWVRVTQVGFSTESIPPLLGLGAVIAPLLKLLDMLKAFGLDPAKLLKTDLGGAGETELKKINSFRARFAADFAEVTQALGTRRRMVIFIDDLDRCTPAHLLQILEASNYLNSSGDCYIVLGMQTESVLAALREKLTDAQLGPPDKSPRRWLEKLVQIDVGLPTDDHELKSNVSSGDDELLPTARQRTVRRGILGIATAGVGFAILWGAIHLADSLPPAKAPSEAAANGATPPVKKTYELELVFPTLTAEGAVSVASGTAADEPEDTGSPSTTESGTPEESPSEETNETASPAAIELPPGLIGDLAQSLAGRTLRVIGDYENGKVSVRFDDTSPELPPPPEDTQPPIEPPNEPTGSGVEAGVTEAENQATVSALKWIVGVLGAITALFAVNRRFESKTEDSEAFISADETWENFTSRICTTPREFHRLTNQMRFDAMLVRALAGEGEEDPLKSREAHIVALAVLQKLSNSTETLQELDDSILELLDAKLHEFGFSPEYQNELRDRASEAVESYQNDPELKAFRLYKRSIRV